MEIIEKTAVECCSISTRKGGNRSRTKTEPTDCRIQEAIRWRRLQLFSADLRDWRCRRADWCSSGCTNSPDLNNPRTKIVGIEGPWKVVERAPIEILPCAANENISARKAKLGHLLKKV